MKARALVPAKFGVPLGMYSHGVIAPAGELVVVAGQVGTRPDGSLAGDDVIAQTYFPSGAYPPNTLLVVSRLVLPALRVEIEAMAIRPHRAVPSGRPSAKKSRTGRRSGGGARRRR